LIQCTQLSTTSFLSYPVLPLEVTRKRRYRILPQFRLPTLRTPRRTYRPCSKRYRDAKKELRLSEPDWRDKRGGEETKSRELGGERKEFPSLRRYRNTRPNYRLPRRPSKIHACTHDGPAVSTSHEIFPSTFIFTLVLVSRLVGGELQGHKRRTSPCTTLDRA